MVGARNWAGAVVAHSRSGLGAGGIRVVGATNESPQLLQKFAPSRFSVLQTGQIKAMAYLLTTLGIQNENLRRLPLRAGVACCISGSAGGWGVLSVSTLQVTATRLERCAMRLAITAPSAIAISSAMLGCRFDISAKRIAVSRHTRPAPVTTTLAECG